jgi:hypothetical protein
MNNYLSYIAYIYELQYTHIYIYVYIIYGYKVRPSSYKLVYKPN